MKFCWCTISVVNMEESLRFYQEIIGLALSRRFMSGEGAEIAFIGEGETLVELICGGKSKKADIGADISLGFEVSSAEEMIKFLTEKGVPVHSGPFQPNPHVRFFYVLDPNGLRIQFVENM